ncbi:tRNA lysidine(34) synthetase TilS [Roseibium aggregatum]|uniref:tRNA(Ile)-lysidine synthase n=1 Tax=Roseibium aggregatum TaxID=187304 RepID=A0A939EG28_9HYPH|nr:tRNA lysidine(34) synthetase TilS [Roseibium aggregatum]MBN9672500.1 tRNA lysidine(34) synthetase TilS [Roseibium aggregatum]
MRNVPETPVGPDGLQASEADLLFQPLTPFSNLALAVSGGADSLSLLVLFNDWRQRTGWGGAVEVVTVDHGLRPESADEAALVAQCAEARDLPHTILCWQGEKPSRNLQEDARLARYRLIAEHMRHSGAEALVLGHHLYDQAETFLDRLTRGSGLAGLSAMAPDEPDGPEGLRLLRPLLSVPRERLEASLAVRGLDWCRDPSNDDPKYKRGRLRRILPLLAAEGLSSERIAQTARQLRRAREALDTVVGQTAAAEIEDHPAGALRLTRDAYCGLAEELRLRLLTHMVLRTAGVRPRLRLQKLETLDRQLMSGKSGRHTLAGVLFETGESWLWAAREPGRSPPETLRNPRGRGIWDRRYRYRFPENETGGMPDRDLFLGPLCSAPVAPPDILWPSGWPKSAFGCSPVVWDADGMAISGPLLAGRAGADSGVGMPFDLERLPIQGRLTVNYVEEGAADGEN